MSTLVSRYKKLVVQHVEAQEQEARAKSRYEGAIADRKKIEQEMAEVEAALEFGESLMATAPGSAAPAQKPSDDDVDDVDDGSGPRKSTRDLLLLIPRDGQATRADFASLGLNTGALNARLMDAKNRDYIETAGRGRYRLTDKGRAVYGPRLKVVPSSSGGGP